MVKTIQDLDARFNRYNILNKQMTQMQHATCCNLLQTQMQHATCLQLRQIDLVCAAATATRVPHGVSVSRGPCPSSDAPDAGRGVELHPCHVCCANTSLEDQHEDGAHQSAER